MSIDGILGFSQNLFLFLVLFGILVFIHEFGHFIVAKAVGIGVEKFFLGFGPKIFSFKRGETEYGVNWIFLGGFVKLVGDEVESGQGAKQENSFMAKPPLSRIAVVSAGPIANFLLPIILFAFLFFVGVPYLGPYIGEVIDGSPAKEGGLLQGDRIVSVDGDKIDKWDDLTDRIRNSKGARINLVVDRKGERKELSLEPKRSTVQNIFREAVDGWTVGITPYQYEPSIGVENKSSKAYRAGFRTGDVIRNINGRDIRYYWEFEKIFREDVSKEITLEIERERISQWTDSRVRAETQTAKSPEEAGIYPALNHRLIADPLGLEIVEGKPAHAWGLRSGDVLKTVNGEEIKSFARLAEIWNAHGGKPLDLSFVRPGGKEAERLTLSLAKKPKVSQAPSDLGFNPSQLFISYVKPMSIASEKGIKPGYVLSSINGEETRSWMDLEKVIRENQGEALTISFLDQGKRHDLSITPRLIDGEDHITGATEKRRELGIEPVAPMKTPAAIEYLEKTYNPIAALYLGAEKTYTILAMQVLGFVKLIQGKLSVKHIGGPILIYKLAGRSFEMGGLLSFISYIALLSIVLGFVNLLPIPIMDGGHIMFFTIEMIKRKPLSIKTREIAQQLGFVFVIFLMLLATYNDIKRYFFSNIAEFFKSIF